MPSKPKRVRRKQPAPSSVDARQDINLVSSIRTILDREDVQLALAIMEDESPAKTIDLPPNADNVSSANVLWQERGYQLCLEKFRALALPFEKPQELIETFRDPTDPEPVTPSEITP